MRKIGWLFLLGFSVMIALLVTAIKVGDWTWFVFLLYLFCFHFCLFMYWLVNNDSVSFKPSLLFSIYWLVWKKIGFCIIYPFTLPYSLLQYIWIEGGKLLFGENPREAIENFLESLEKALRQNDYTLLPFVKSEAVLVQVENGYFQHRFEKYEETNIYVSFKGKVYAVFLKEKPVFITTYYVGWEDRNLLLKQTYKIRSLKKLKLPSELML